MSPHLILILMVSSCSLLIILLFAVRKRAKKTLINTPAAQASDDLLSNISIDLSGFHIPPQKQPVSIPITNISEEPSVSDLIQLVTRHRFFQGKNLETFSNLAQQKNWNGVQQLIAEKMLAQGKQNAHQQAEEMTGKLQKVLVSVRS